MIIDVLKKRKESSSSQEDAVLTDSPPAYEVVDLAFPPSTRIDSNTESGAFSSDDRSSSLPLVIAPTGSNLRSHSTEQITVNLNAPSAQIDAQGSDTSPALSQPPKIIPKSTPDIILHPFLPLDRKGKGKRAAKRFDHSRASLETVDPKALLAGFLRDLVKQPEMWPSVGLILKGCSEACNSYGLSLSSLLQEQSVEGHSPIYWAVLKCPTQSCIRSSHDLLRQFLCSAAPLSEATISEVRLACLHNSDQALFQRLRRSGAVSPLSGSEEMLLGTFVPPDEVEVEDVLDEEDTFVARFQVPMFQKRMRVAKQINLEFIARDRLWSMKFLVASAENVRLRPSARPGTWIVTLSLLEHSPQTWIDSRLIIEDARESCGHSSCHTSGRLETKEKHVNWLRLRTGSAKLGPTRQAIAAPFKDELMVHRLQSHNGPYITAGGYLRARLEARLSKPEVDCIIC